MTQLHSSEFEKRSQFLKLVKTIRFCRFQAEENGTVVPDDKDTIKRLASDPMFKLDRGDVDVSKAKKDAHPRINKLAQIQGLILPYIAQYLNGRLILNVL